MYGDPSEYMYEVDEEIYSYQEFIDGKFINPDLTSKDEDADPKDTGNDTTSDKQDLTPDDIELKFDLSMLHTLRPEDKKAQLYAMGAKPKVQSPLAYRYAAFGESLNKVLDNIFTSEF